jgi:molybdopterin-guanine dinucleotide biosynthesis protein A
MGRDKATLAIGDRNLINLVHETVSRVFEEIIVISSCHDRMEGLDVPIVQDFMPVRSPLTGILSALLHTRSTYTFVVGCDMPFISQEAIEEVLGQAHGEDVIIPLTEKGYEPLHALYNRSCISYFLSSLEKKRLRVIDAFPFLSVKTLQKDSAFFHRHYSVFTNLNTIDELGILKSFLKG